MTRLKYILVLLLTLILLPLSAKKRQQVPDSLLALSFEINGVPFTMQRVEGGSYIMGATSDQYDPDTYTDKPAHLVFLSSFYIATTEVTNQLWKAVMPDRETLSPSGYPYNPISYVSWYDCQEFVRRLDSITGFHFRLPTEAEWEYAAREVHRSRKAREKLSPWTELVGIRLSLPDDPILLEFKGDTNEKRSLRLVIHIR